MDEELFAWDELESLLDQLFALPRDAHDELLDSVRSKNTALAKKLEHLYAVGTANHTLFDSDAFTFCAPALANSSLSDAVHSITSDALLPGNRLGQYLIVEEIGYGGTSTVYRARRNDGQFDQEVAIKVLHQRTLDRAQLVERFYIERQILARLNHTNIAHIYDGGTTEGGRPYLVMEYVDGEPITSFASSSQLSLKKRIALFKQVCQAVQHAHAEHIVHRDLKPSNVLVTRDGIVKLLDFGIAKILADSAFTMVVETQTYSRLLTPQYAAPEQVLRQEITYATDVYALGLMLFELVAGRRPYDIANLSPAEIQVLICNQPHAVPSHKISENDGYHTGIPEPVTLWRRQLVGDLDTIVMKALRKDGRQRYTSVQALIEDLNRFQRQMPIKARPISYSYRIGKFVQRNRRRVVGFSVILLLIASIITAYSLVLRAERLNLNAEAKKNEHLALFMQSLNELNNLSDSSGMQELLSNMLERAESLNEYPDAKAEILINIGEMYHRQGLQQEAASTFSNAIEALRGHYGDRHSEVGHAITQLAWVEVVRDAYPVAETLFTKALNIQLEAKGRNSSQYAENLHGLSQIMMHKKRYEEAEKLEREALKINLGILGPEHLHIANQVLDFSLILMLLDKMEEAEKYARQAISIREKVFGVNHPQYAFALKRLAMIMNHQGVFEESHALFGETKSILSETLGPDHPESTSTDKWIRIVEERAKTRYSQQDQ